MVTHGEDLYRLQRLDSEGDAKQRRLVEVKAALVENEALEQARQQLEAAQDPVRRWTHRQRDLELQVQGLSDKISRSEQRLYGGKVKNPKELADLQAKVASLERRRQEREDDLLEAMIEREEAETARAQAGAHFDQTESRWAARQADLTAERERLQARLAEIEQERDALLTRIDAGDLTAYEALRSRKGGQAVTQVVDGACAACGVSVPSRLKWQLRQGELVHCDNCERIIVQT